jgi:multimeric flavodoxin WrbA
MKAILLSASPRAKGNTMDILNVCAGAMRAKGVATNIISLAGKKINACVACGKCSDGLGRCAINDDFQPIAEEIKPARGFIIGAPVYFGTARGDAMNFLQRLGMISRSGDNFLARKVGGPLAVARRGGHTATIQEMLMFFFINGMTVPGADYWNMVFGRLPGEAIQDEEGVKTAFTFAENTARLIILEENAAALQKAD